MILDDRETERERRNRAGDRAGAEKESGERERERRKRARDSGVGNKTHKKLTICKVKYLQYVK
jgi:hypothetical protein